MLDFLEQSRDPDSGRVIRRVRSFVLRAGRLTRGQENAINTHWATHGLEQQAGCINPDTLFNRKAPLVLEIGYGMGASLLEMAAAAPDTDFIGVEVHRPGVGALLIGIAEQQLGNVKTYCDDGVDILTHCIPDASLDRLQLFFPDPWHKKRHYKRRIVQPDWLTLVASKLKPGGLVHLATDWEVYAHHMRECCEAAPELVNRGNADGFADKPAWRPSTKFERRGRNLGHGVWDLLWEKQA